MTKSLIAIVVLLVSTVLYGQEIAPEDASLNSQLWLDFNGKYQLDEDLYLWCHSEMRQCKEKAIRSSKEDKLIEQLNYYKEGLKKPRRTKNYHKLSEI